MIEDVHGVTTGTRINMDHAAVFIEWIGRENTRFWMLDDYLLGNEDAVKKIRSGILLYFMTNEKTEDKMLL